MAISGTGRSTSRVNQNMHIKGQVQIDDKVGFHGTTPPAQPAHIADASGGSTVDAEARTAINAVLAALESLGLVASS